MVVTESQQHDAQQSPAAPSPELPCPALVHCPMFVRNNRVLHSQSAMGRQYSIAWYSSMKHSMAQRGTVKPYSPYCSAVH